MEFDLMNAIWSGQVDRVQELLAAGANVNAADPRSGSTLLHAAADVGNLQGVQLLLDSGANIHAADNEGETVLHTAAEAGHAQVVQLLLAAGASVSAADSDGFTPLHRFVDTAAGHYEVVQLLLRNGADPRPRDANCFHESRSILQSAAMRGHKRIVELLLESWGEPQITAAELTAAAIIAAGNRHLPSISAPGSRGLATFAVLAKELRKLYPAALQGLVGSTTVNIPASVVVAAVLDEWAADVSSLDEQRAALHKREEAVASEQQKMQQLIVAVAGVAQGCAEPEPEPESEPSAQQESGDM